MSFAIIDKNPLPPGFPPDLVGKFRHTRSGTSTKLNLEEDSDISCPWIPYTKVKFYTNVFVLKDDKILLGYKKRGFGIHKYNGFGGKVETGETSLEAACRELEEESGLRPPASSSSPLPPPPISPLRHIGVLFFVTEDAEHAFHIDIYRADGMEGVEGKVKETDEMRPEWFSFSEIPYEKMWEDDLYWMPLLLEDKTPFWVRVDFRFESSLLGGSKDGAPEGQGAANEQIKGKEELIFARWWVGEVEGKEKTFSR